MKLTIIKVEITNFKHYHWFSCNLSQTSKTQHAILSFLGSLNTKIRNVKFTATKKHLRILLTMQVFKCNVYPDINPFFSHQTKEEMCHIIPKCCIPFYKFILIQTCLAYHTYHTDWLLQCNTCEAPHTSWKWRSWKNFHWTIKSCINNLITGVEHLLLCTLLNNKNGLENIQLLQQNCHFTLTLLHYNQNLYIFPQNGLFVFVFKRRGNFLKWNLQYPMTKRFLLSITTNKSFKVWNQDSINIHYIMASYQYYLRNISHGSQMLKTL